MAIEIERKFLLKNSSWQQHAEQGTLYSQGYLIGGQQASVRVRIEGERAYLNIKSATIGITRQEYEYEIPVNDALEMLEMLCEKPLISKTRYHVNYADHVWEIDVFAGENLGLVVAEIELNSKDETFELPDWIGKEVSDDVRYYNVNLVKCPYKSWS